MSYIQPKTTYPYFSYSGGKTTLASINVALDISSNFFETKLEEGSTDLSLCRFTAPTKGLYYFEILFNCRNNTGSGDDTGQWGFAIKKGSNPEIFRFVTDNPEYFSTDGTEYNTRFSTIVYLNAGDYVRGVVNGFSAGQFYLVGQNYFSGYLISAFN